MRILLVEDTVTLGECVREQIADDGHAVDWMLTLAQAKASVASTQYDLILLDLMLPDGKNIDFLKRLHASGDSTPEARRRFRKSMPLPSGSIRSNRIKSYWVLATLAFACARVSIQSTAWPSSAICSRTHSPKVTVSSTNKIRIRCFLLRGNRLLAYQILSIYSTC